MLGTKKAVISFIVSPDVVNTVHEFTLSKFHEIGNCCGLRVSSQIVEQKDPWLFPADFLLIFPKNAPITSWFPKLKTLHPTQLFLETSRNFVAGDHHLEIRCGDLRKHVAGSRGTYCKDPILKHTAATFWNMLPWPPRRFVIASKKNWKNLLDVGRKFRFPEPS